MTADAPEVDWSTWLASVDWRQGEHVSVIGPTGQGKSTLLLALAEHRRYVLMLATKPKDATLAQLTTGPRPYVKVASWPPRLGPELAPKVLLWPKLATPADMYRQADMVQAALADVYSQGGWCVGADELYYLSKKLGCRGILELLWQHGRSLGVSMLGATQRPAHVPLELYSQATHLCLFRANDRRDRQRLADVGGEVDPATIHQLCSRLRKHSFLYVNTRTGQLAISSTPAPSTKG